MAPTREWLAALLERAALLQHAHPPPPLPPPPSAPAAASLPEHLLARLLTSPPPPQAAALLLAAAALLLLILPRVAAEVDAWRRWSKIPGPPSPSLLLGHAPVLNTARAPMSLLSFAEEHGDVFRLRLAHRRAVVVGDPAAFALLTRRPSAAAGKASVSGLPLPKDGAMYAPLDVGINSRGKRPRSLLTEPHDSPLWWAVRKAVAPAFSASSMRARVFPLLRGLLQDVTAHLTAEHARLGKEQEQEQEQEAEAAAAEGGGGGSGGGNPSSSVSPTTSEVDVDEVAKCLTADVIFQLLFGEPLGATRHLVSRPLPPPGIAGTKAAEREVRARAEAAAARLLGDAPAGEKGAGTDAASATAAAADAAVAPHEYMAMVEQLLLIARRVLGNPLRRPLAPLLRLLGDADALSDDRVERAYGALMRARLERLERDPPPEGTIARAILEAVDPSTGQRLGARRRESELAVVLAAGFETTSRAITSTLAALAEHPGAQDKVAEELRRAGLAQGPPAAATADAAAAAAGGKDNKKKQQQQQQPPRRPLEYADLSPQALPYLHAVLRESLRLFPPAALGTGRLAGGPGGAGTEVLGSDVPPGTLVMLPVYVSARRTTVYGPDAAEFRPERWLAERPPPEPPSFSKGPRDCVGRPLAQLELVAAVAALVAAFRWSPAPRVVAAGGMEAMLSYRITLGAEAGMPILFEPRV